MPQLAEGLSSGQRVRAQASLAGVRKDLALIALFDFSATEPFPGVFRMAQGRWPGSRAPEFVHTGDHLKVNVGAEQEWAQLTLAAWVRIELLLLGRALSDAEVRDLFQSGNPYR